MIMDHCVGNSMHWAATHSIEHITCCYYYYCLSNAMHGSGPI